MELKNRINKYKNRFRVLVIKTPDYKNKLYLELKQKIEDNQKILHKYYIKFIISKLIKYSKPSLELYGFDGNIKKKYLIIDINKIINKIIQDVEKMPMGKHVKPTNQSLFVDYNPKTTITGLGYKDEKKAIETINKIKSHPINYQKQVINTMIGRAKHHPNQTNDMKKAIKIFEEYKNKF